MPQKPEKSKTVKKGAGSGVDDLKGIQRPSHMMVNGIPLKKILEIAEYVGVKDTVIIILPRQVVGLLGKCYPLLCGKVIELSSDMNVEGYANKHYFDQYGEDTIAWLVILHEFYHSLEHICAIPLEDAERIISGRNEGYVKGREKATEDQEDEADRWAVEMFYELKREHKI